MQKISVITGGAGGMGVATARVLGRDHHVVISDINPERLETSRKELVQLGIRCDAIICDISNPQSVRELLQQSARLGQLASVIHTAGLSPQMADPATILQVNALGTVNVTNSCYEFASDGFALVNVASMAAYVFPGLLVPARAYSLASTEPERFLKKVLFRCRFMPTKLYRNGMAYAISKHFVIWLSKANAVRFGTKNARILTVSPGTFDTEMGRLEEQSGSMKMLKQAALKRAGEPEEIAELLAFCASEKAGYLTGTDILCDGGTVTGRTVKPLP